MEGEFYVLACRRLHVLDHADYPGTKPEMWIPLRFANSAFSAGLLRCWLSAFRKLVELAESHSLSTAQSVACLSDTLTRLKVARKDGFEPTTGFLLSINSAAPPTSRAAYVLN